ncbi:creatininase family protein [Halomarina halobia]|uniref:Creatininase family protein n=1 Tax=Halomarina halobia TaxID=3033386 RepID=A0ABD6AF17_9EURY|nr:creatininase family protein [Halomarina sp. PSR21]
MSRNALQLRRGELTDAAIGGGVAIVPTGSLEQHGAHLPVGTDSLLAEAVSLGAADVATDRGVDTVVFPAIWTGFSPHHVPLGATVTISKETLLALLDDVCESIIRMGFRNVLLVNGHGGNRPAVSLAAGDLGTRQDEADVGGLSYNTLAADLFSELREGDSGSAYHAGEFETALMLYLHGAAVEMSAATDEPESRLTPYSGRDMFDGGPLGMRRTYDRLTEDGVRGEPTLATPEIGEKLFEELTDRLADLVVEFADLGE